MNRTRYLLLVFALMYVSSIHAQWLSIEGALVSGNGKNLETSESFSITDVLGQVQDMDTIYINRQTSGEILRQQRISLTRNLSVAGHLHIPIKPKWTGKIGFGLSNTFFQYRDVLELRNYNEVLDTINCYIPKKADCCHQKSLSYTRGVKGCKF